MKDDISLKGNFIFSSLFTILGLGAWILTKWYTKNFDDLKAEHNFLPEEIIELPKDVAPAPYRTPAAELRLDQ